MGLAYDLKLERRTRARQAAGMVSPVMPPQPRRSMLEPQEVIAIKRVRLGQQRYEPGQSLVLGGDLLRELLDKKEVWAPTKPSDADWWLVDGRVLQAEPGEAHPRKYYGTDGSLTVVQGCAYDPGNAVYRYHSAFNEHTKHAGIFVRYGGSNPFQCPIQIDGRADPETARRYIWDADVLHHHVDYYLTGSGFGPRPRREQLVIRHYHGSLPPGRGEQWALRKESRLKDDALGAVLLGARLTLCALRPGRIQWLPIPVPVARYAAMRPAERAPGPFRIAHSPTKAEYKGTQVFLDVCDRLNKRGVKVEPVLIGMARRGRNLYPARKSHAEALRIKAGCDAVFDSFWLGIQGSGLEGAAMGLPVIAGDPEVADLYRDAIGYVPYSFANDAKRLEAEIEALATSETWRQEGADTVHQYVCEHHDYPRVAARYESILAKALGREDVLTR